MENIDGENFNWNYLALVKSLVKNHKRVLPRNRWVVQTAGASVPEMICRTWRNE
jgi:hypothetical protein